ncbi:NAD(P)-dependent oxidoreductase [Luedemannella flava]|uniref:NAD(P)-dependent oxidoreductase n=1 Tax=Luedemannella flava TaxID=349316 RepID=A0ABN2MHT2_9ACTN
MVAEAADRGHEVIAVTRSTGDVTDVDDVARLAAGHDAVVNAAARVDVPTFFADAARALVDGLRRAGVRRLVGVGIGTALEAAPGVAVHDAPDFPAPYRAFSLNHAAQVDVLRGADDELDWLLLAPPPVVLDDTADRTGRYQLGEARALPGGFSYVDLAVAIVDEIDTPTRHRAVVAVGAR